MKAIKLEAPQAPWSETHPTYDWLDMFVCEGYALIPREKRKELASLLRKCIFLDNYGTNGNISFRLGDLEHKKVI